MSSNSQVKLTIKRIDRFNWGAFNRNDRQVLTIEKKAPECFPEFAVRECLPNARKGGVLVEFLGPEAFSGACDWAQTREPLAPQVRPLTGHLVKGREKQFAR